MQYPLQTSSGCSGLTLLESKLSLPLTFNIPRLWVLDWDTFVDMTKNEGTFTFSIFRICNRDMTCHRGKRLSEDKIKKSVVPV